MKLFFGLLIFLIIAAAIFFGIIYYSYSIDAEAPEVNAATKYCMDKLEVSEIDWKTAVITVTKKSDIEKKYLWRVLSDLNLWKDWHGLWLLNVAWNNGDAWEPGSRFKEYLDLGFPFGQKEFEQNVVLAENGEDKTRLAWTNDQYGIRSCHAWYLIQQNDGKTYIINTAVYTGNPIGYAKPFIVSPWLTMFADDIKGLIREAAIRM